ncbi:MAG: hypothetical protein ACRDQD_30295 [Nocardioidaceae bacterium]
MGELFDLSGVAAVVTGSNRRARSTSTTTPTLVTPAADAVAAFLP